MRTPRVGKRMDIAWLAAALTLGAGGYAFATAASSPEGDNGGRVQAPLALASVDDPALASTDPADDDAAAKLIQATGVAASDPAAAPQAWAVGDHSVLGYTASGGRFCFEFRSHGGGCLEPGALTQEQPIDLTTDFGPGVFAVYGLARDGVTAVSVRVDGNSWSAALAHNAFFFSDDALGRSGAIAGEVVATMSDGSTRTAPFHADLPAIQPASQ
jgi:hypothetical protein